MGVVFSEQSNYSKALKYYLKAIKIYRDINNYENNARLYNNVGIVYLCQDNETNALPYFLKCLKIQEKIKDPTIGITITNIGNIYNSQKKYKKAIRYYNRAFKLFEKYPNQRGLGELYNNIGTYFQNIGDFINASKNYQKAEETFLSINDKFGISDTYFFMGDLYFMQKKYAEAIQYVEKSLNLSKKLDVPVQMKKAEQKLFLIYQKLNQPEHALEHFMKYSEIKDSILNHENIRNNIRAELDFEFDKKELSYQKEKEKNTLIYKEKLKQNQQIIIYIGTFTLLIIGFLFILYKRKQANKTLRLKLEIIEYEQKALLLQMNPHFIFNCLGSISSFILQNNTDEAIKYLSKFSKLMRLTLEFSKESSIPLDKEMESLENYLELEKLRFNNVFTYELTKSKMIEDDIALPSLLIQPFIENAIIHGVVPKKGNGKIKIKFDVTDEFLICTIEDNGVGIFESQKSKKGLVNLHKSMALEITKNRLKMMESILDKKTGIDIQELFDDNKLVIGTKITVKLPIQYQN